MPRRRESSPRDRAPVAVHASSARRVRGRARRVPVPIRLGRARPLRRRRASKLEEVLPVVTRGRPSESGSPKGSEPACSRDRGGGDTAARASDGFDAGVHPGACPDGHHRNAALSRATSSVRRDITAGGAERRGDDTLATGPSRRGGGSVLRRPEQRAREQRFDPRTALRLTVLCLAGAALLGAVSATLLRTGVDARGDGGEVAATIAGIWGATGALALLVAGVGRLGRLGEPGARQQQRGAPPVAACVVEPRRAGTPTAPGTARTEAGVRRATRGSADATGGRPGTVGRVGVTPERARPPSAGRWN